MRAKSKKKEKEDLQLLGNELGNLDGFGIAKKQLEVGMKVKETQNQRHAEV